MQRGTLGMPLEARVFFAGFYVSSTSFGHVLRTGNLFCKAI